MSISQLVPIPQREGALVRETHQAGRPLKTGELVDTAITCFPQLTPSELRRRTPSGTLWWRGRFRFDLDQLKKKGLIFQPAKGYWQAIGIRGQRATRPSAIPEAGLMKRTCKTARKVLSSIEKDEIRGLCTWARTK